MFGGNKSEREPCQSFAVKRILAAVNLDGIVPGSLNRG